ncbi:DNA translocase FtsK 4TM domain-containing protein [Microvirga sp. W0021]|uniref:DNA translocase FtsK n=1 Tax=Hohaiivirga grylli TaxID=3133970 RepID=A0ABV0BGB4_9HYPH
MRKSRPTPLESLSDLFRAFLARCAKELIGITLLLLSGAMVVALATWSVDDPSFNNAVDGPVKNTLGWIGAISADLVMQLFGLGAIVILCTMLIWGWRLITKARIDKVQLRLVLWILGVFTATAMASSFPATAQWPLPTGLGGVVGDGLVSAAKAITGLSGGPAKIILGSVFAIITILCLTAACGFGMHEQEPQYQPLDDAEEEEYWEEPEDTHREDEPGWGIVSLGAIAHGFMSISSTLRRWTAKRSEPKLAMARGGNMHFEQPRMASEMPGGGMAGGPMMRREPSFGAPVQLHHGYQPQPEPQYHDDYQSHFEPSHAPVLHDDDDIEPWHDGETYIPHPAPVVERPQNRVMLQRSEAENIVHSVSDEEAYQAGRVGPAPTAPKQGKRIVREAQPSFLNEESYELPPLTLLAEPPKTNTNAISTDALEQNAALLESTLQDFGVNGEIINVRPGPVVTLYELEPAPGTKSSRVISLADDIARSMSAISARVAVIPGRNAIGVELPNHKRETVYLRELLASQDFESSKHKLALCLGKTIGGEPVIVDLARMPHLLIAGTTGSGKSVAINTMILSLLYRLKPEECRLIMVDPKMLELSIYEGIPHLLTPVVTDPKKAVVALKWAVREMEDRYKKMSKLGVRNIDGFNARVKEAKAKGEEITRTIQTGFDRETGEALYEQENMDLEPLPYIVIVVDEMADLMIVAGKEIEGTIQRLAQMARAAGIHVVLATQRPSVDVITGTIKANFPTRISFQVTSKIDSRTILGEMGAEQLLGQGDMLYMAGGGRITRVHGPFCSDEEVEHVVTHLKQQGQPSYLSSVTEAEEEAGSDGAVFDNTSFGSPGGDLYDQAVALVLRDKKASTSYIQRRLQIGYNRAASIMERMEQEGIVSPANNVGKREILMQSPTEFADEEA